MARPSWTVGRPSVSTPRLHLTIYNVQPGPSVYVRFLANPCCTLIHWHQGRSYPCVEPSDICPHCDQRREKIPVGYAAAELWGADANSHQRWITKVCALTDKALEVLCQVELRGKVYALRRKGSRINSELVAEYHETNTVGMGVEFDPMEVVENCWRNYLATFPVAGQLQLPNVVPNVQVVGDGPREVDMVFDQAGDLVPLQARDQKGGAL